MLGTIERHRDRVIESSIDPHTRWRPGAADSAEIERDAGQLAALQETR
jgi:hypothetical protein